MFKKHDYMNTGDHYTWKPLGNILMLQLQGSLGNFQVREVIHYRVFIQLTL